jgi:hypothetical protein
MPTAVPRINDVEVRGGSMNAVEYAPKPYFYIRADDMTVVAKEYDKAGRLVRFAITSQGTQIKRSACDAPLIVATNDGDKRRCGCATGRA